MEPLETRDDAGAGRTQHVIHILLRDDAAAASLLIPGLERVEGTQASPQVLVIAPDRDSVFSLAAAVNARAGREDALVVPVVASPRGERRLRAGAQVICATAADLVTLMSRALFKPDQLRSVAVVWADEQLGESARPALETVLAEVPRDADRLLLVSALGEAVEGFATGFLWRARRMQHPPAPVTPAGTLEYVPCVPQARATLVRLLLERLDPATVAAVVYSDAGERDARAALASLGYGIATDDCRIVRDRIEGRVDLALIMELPEEFGDLAAARGDATRAIALVPPSRVVALAAALGENGTPLAITQVVRDAYTARDLLRDEIHGSLRGRPLTSEVLALEPLIAEHDPVLLAAALWRLLETERSRSKRTAVAPAPALRMDPSMASHPRARGDAPRGAEGAFTRLFLNIGERDGMRRGDLVGAITGEAGIDGSRIGKIELRDTHALVEVASDVAEQVVARLTGVSMRGRKVVAKVDGGRPAGDRGEGGHGREERPRRREFGRSEGGRAGASGGRDPGARSGRSPGGRREGGGRGPSAMRESEEWGSRGDRLRQSRPRRNDT